MKNFIKGRWFPLLVGITVFVVVAFVMAKFGWRITYAPELENSWAAISAVAACVSALAGIAIPIVAVAFQYKLDSNKKDIKGSNLELYSKLERIEKELEEYRNGKYINPANLSSNVASSNHDTLKARILEYIGVAMGATTRDVAAHLGISTQATVKLLQELRNSGLIVTKYIREDTNSETCHWKRR